MQSLTKRLSSTHRVRCKCWSVCNVNNCRHYDSHPPALCCMYNPVKYCSIIKGFVHDTPMTEIDPDYKCDPNVIFKAKRDEERSNSQRGSDDGVDF